VSVSSLSTANYAGAEHDRRWRTLTFPADYHNPVPQDRYHLVVIGAGPAGLVCAIGAVGLGAKVALIERQAMGGDCLNVGCVPSKALLEYTRRHAPAPSFDAAFAWMREVRAGIAEHDSVERYTSHGVDVFLGAAEFVDASTVRVNGQTLTGRRIVIATGARASIPNVPGLRDADPLTNETVFALERAPKSLAIVGAGPIGCELAQALSRLGIRIHLLDTADRVLQNEEPDASQVVMDTLIRSGVEMRLGSNLTNVERRGDEWAMTVNGSELLVERILVAAGRAANTNNLNLAAADVALTPEGLIKVDDRLRTTNSRLYAAGDVCSRLQFTHHADAQARIVIQNALFAPTARANHLVVPHCTYTTPEVAQVGRTKAALERDGVAFDRYGMLLSELDRGRAAGDTESFAELLVERGRSTLLGATVVAEDAGELIVPICIAMTQKLTLSDLGKTVFPYPTRSEYLRRLADNYGRTRLTPLVKKLMEMWLRMTG
jgi:pyruvate/2-oxoglutarate dehydrogenase complex dihydrolipoamide dehydrogenase (E3) component